MAYITSRRGTHDNVVTYEFICDTTADMTNIEQQYITLGSVCVVINGNIGNLEVYIANSNKEWVSIGQINGDPSTIEELREMVDAIVESSTAAVEAISSAEEIVEDAQEYAEISEAWAIGKKNGVVVGSSEPQYQNNAKYWSDHAFSATPQGYEDLVDDVDDLKSALGLSSVTAQSTVKISGATIIGETITNPYASTNIYGPVSVQKGDSVTVTGINCNSALTALSYCDENVTIVYDIISAGKGADVTQEYTVTADRYGYIAIVSTTAATPSYKVDRFALKATYDNEIEEINNALDENSIANYVVPYESTNVFDATAITPGKLCNGYGTLDDNPSAIVTDFYSVSPGDKVRFIPYSPNINQSIYVFKADGTVLATGYYPRTDYDDYSEITIPSGNNAGAKFRLNIFFRDFTDTVITINQQFSRSLAGQKGKYFSLNQYDYESRLFGKFITYNGDSICEGRYNGTASNGGAYANIISRLTGSRAENRAISGGILASAVPSGTTPQRLIVNDIVNMSADADLVCLEGGYNDYARNVPLGEITPEKEITAESAIATLDTTTICGALESIFRQARLKWLGKPIVFVIVHKVQNSYYTNNTASTPYTFKDVHDKIVQICNKYAIPYYDACLYSGLNGHDVNQSNTYLTSNYTGTGDGTHPNEAGYRRYYVPQLIKLFESVMPMLESE